MTGEKQYFQVLFNKGVDQKTDPKLVQDGLLKLENGVLRDSPGQLPSGQKVTMRYGYLNLGNTISSSSGSSSLTGGEALGVFNDELLLFNKNKLYSRAYFNSSYVDKGSVVPLSLTTKPIVKNSASQTKGDFDILNNVGVVAWTDSRGGVKATVYDTFTGNIFQSDVTISTTADNARVRAIGSYIFVFFNDTTANSVKFRRLLISNPFTFIAEQTLIGSVHATARWYDVQQSGSLIAWCAHLAANTIQIGYVDQNGSTVAAGTPSAVNFAEAATNGLGLFVNSQQFLFVFFHNSTNGTRVVGYTFSLTTPSFSVQTIEATTSPETVNLTATSVDSSNVTIFYEVTSAATYNRIVKKCNVTTGGSVTGVTTVLRSVGLASKAFTQDSVQYVNVLYSSTTQPTYFTVNSSGVVVAKLGPGLAGALTQSYLPQIVSSDDSVWSWTSSRKTQFVSSTTSLTGIFRSDLDFGTFDRYYNAQLGGNTHITGGFLAQYDGNSVVESGFHLYPEVPTLAQNAASGNLSNGTYQVIIVYEWTDAQGQLHRSNPSTAASITLSGGGATQRIDVTIPTLRVTSKTSPRSEVVCAVYRTTLGGSLFYRVVSTDGTQEPKFNSISADTVSFSINSTCDNDAALISRELLYTTGGVLENIAPPPVKYVVASKNRVLVNNAEDPNEVWYSKTYSKNEGISFNDAFVMRLDPLGGDLKGLFPMDDKILLFKENNLYFISGDGPTNTGIQNTFTEPQLIASDVGLKDSNSIALTDRGLVFNSNKGKYLLGRSLELSYIGAPVEALNNLTCTSADLITSQNQVRFLHSDGSCAVWDTYYNQWSTFANHSGQDAVIWNGKYHYLRNTNGSIFAEEPDFYLDDNQAIVLTVETPWIKVGGIQNMQRVKRAHILGDLYSAHTLRLEASYDYNEGVYPTALEFDPSSVISTSVYGTGTYGSESVYGGVADGTYQVRAHLPIQKCESIKFRLSNVSTTGSGKAMGLSHLELECVMKTGNAKLRSGKSI